VKKNYRLSSKTVITIAAISSVGFPLSARGADSTEIAPKDKPKANVVLPNVESSGVETNTPSLGGPIYPLPLKQGPTTSPEVTPGMAPNPVNSFTSTPSRFATSGESSTPSLGSPTFALPSAATFASATENPLQLGPFVLHPHFDYQFTYGTGINFTPGNQELTAMHSLSPGMGIQSKHLTIDYTPTLVYYSKGSFEDSVNHSANFLSAFGYNDWQFQISQGYQKNSSPLIETGTQTDTESFTTLLSGQYHYTEKTSFDFSVTQLLQNAEALNNTRQWSTMDWVNFKLGSSTSIGAGVGGGYVDQDLGSNMTYEQVQGRVGWRPSEKTYLDLNGGIEIRQVLDSPNSSDRISPLMGASFSYSLFKQTTLGLQANQIVSSSLFQDQVTESSSITGSLNQRLLARLNLGLTGGFRTTDYIGTGTSDTTDRSDDYSFISVSLGTRIFKKGNVSVGYQHSTNDSTLAGYTYDSDQYTFQLGYHF
jgi:hypothetical protein